MKKFVILSSSVALMFAASAASYVEVGYASISVKEDVFKSSPSALRGMFGYEVSENVSVEAMVAVGIGGSSVKNLPGVELKIDNAIGLYVKPKASIGESLELFGRLGFARVEGTASASGNSSSNSDSGLSFGAGGSYKLNKTSAINLDYMQYFNKNGTKASGISLGYVVKF